MVFKRLTMGRKFNRYKTKLITKLNNKMNKYYQFSDEYKQLHNIFYNGAHYTIKEILEDDLLTDKIKIQLIKENIN